MHHLKRTYHVRRHRYTYKHQEHKKIQGIAFRRISLKFKNMDAV